MSWVEWMSLRIAKDLYDRAPDLFKLVSAGVIPLAAAARIADARRAHVRRWLAIIKPR